MSRTLVKYKYRRYFDGILISDKSSEELEKEIAIIEEEQKK